MQKYTAAFCLLFSLLAWFRFAVDSFPPANGKPGVISYQVIGRMFTPPVLSERGPKPFKTKRLVHTKTDVFTLPAGVRVAFEDFKSPSVGITDAQPLLPIAHPHTPLRAPPALF